LPFIHLLISKHPLFARYDNILSKYIAPQTDNNFHADIPLFAQTAVLSTKLLLPSHAQSTCLFLHVFPVSALVAFHHCLVTHCNEHM
jgi:hypothetical protein